MTVDKNLFAYDLAIVSILKNEAPYLREWLDYHLLAGVEHFYLYNNDSSDFYDEIIKPYVEAGLVTSNEISGGSAQFAAYVDAVLNYRFYCRRMAFIDLDEFIFPKDTSEEISVTLDEILKNFPEASGLAINWQIFGSNDEVMADYSRGVLERFTRRAPSDWVVPIPNRDIPGGNAQVKTIANPRRIHFFTSAHFPIYFEGHYSVNERGEVVPNYCNEPVTADKIVINHYNVKSREEFHSKLSKGRADKAGNYFDASWFDMYDRNEVFDEGILKYQAVRSEKFSYEGDAAKIKRMKNALVKNLSAEEFSLEAMLTCRAASNFVGEDFFEATAVAAVLESLEGMTLPEVRLFLSELPELLILPYPAVKDLRNVSILIISQTMTFMREKELWKDFSDLENLRRLIEKI